MLRACAPTPRRLGWRVAAVALLGSLCGASGEPPLTLSLRAPDGCPTQDALRERVSLLLGKASPSRLSVNAAVVVEPDGHDGFRLHMDTVSAGLRGHRTIAGPSCRAVLDSAALVLALMIDFEAVSDPSAAASASAAPPAPPSASVAPIAPPAASASASLSSSSPLAATPPADRRLRWQLDAAAVIEAGALPGVGAGVEVGAAAMTARGRVGLRGLYLGPRERRLGDRPDAGGDFQMGAAAAEGCLRPSAAWPWGCAGASLARIAGSISSNCTA